MPDVVDCAAHVIFVVLISCWSTRVIAEWPLLERNTYQINIQVAMPAYGLWPAQSDLTLLDLSAFAVKDQALAEQAKDQCSTTGLR